MSCVYMGLMIAIWRLFWVQEALRHREGVSGRHFVLLLGINRIILAGWMISGIDARGGLTSTSGDNIEGFHQGSQTII